MGIRRARSSTWCGARRALFSAASVGVLLAAGCGGSGDGGGGTPATGEEQAESSGAPMRVALSTAPATLDPPSTLQLTDTISQNFYVRLVKLGTKQDDNGTTVTDPSKIEPYLASSWKVSDDSRRYEFTLKPGLEFASGTPVDAKAVKFSFERALGLPIGAAFITNLIPDNIESIEAPSPTRVVIRLRKSDPNALRSYTTVGASIVDPSVAQSKGDKYLATHEAGAGPYQMTDYRPGSGLVMEARPEYAAWAGSAPPAERIEVSFVQSDSTLLLQAQSGKADVTIGLSKQGAKTLQDAGARVMVNPTSTTEQILLPWNKEPFGDPKVREAFLLAVPYDAIVEQVASGFAVPMYGPLAAAFPYSNPELTTPLQTDVERAKQLIAESGLSTPIPVTLTIDQGNGIHEQLATILQSSWKEIGVDLKIEKLSSADYAGAVFSYKVQSALRLDGPALVDPGFYLGYDMACKPPGAPQNPAAICLPEADALLAEARSSTDEQANQRRYDEISRIWRAAFPKGILYNDVAATVLSDRVEDWRFDYVLDMVGWSVA